MATSIVLTVAAVLMVLVGVLAVLTPIARATADKSKWGINLRRVHCPRCGTPLPMIRRPASPQEAMWGGWTCPKCGCKVDKWGREISMDAS
jgi:hypothetical protein